jgi:hypothetical protein
MSVERSRELDLQWQDSAPEMDYFDWLQAEVGIQLELVDDYDPGVDPDGLRHHYAYIMEIIVEIRRLLK